MVDVSCTPAQTVGPFLAIVLPWSDGPDVVDRRTPGAITIAGRMTDGSGAPVSDGLVETWQADPEGRFAHPDDPRGAVAPGFRGFGRCASDADGRYWIRTLKPGALPAEDGAVEAPHIDVSVFARGLLNRLVTRLYFPDEVAGNAVDPVLSRLAENERRLLVARPDRDGALRFDLRLQGESETPFFTL